jgi:uncharacterized membrane protein YfcA
MEPWQAYLILCPAAAIGGAINAVAGGGTLVTFPALMFVLGNVPGAAIIANATNTVALCPGAFSGSWGYRREIRQLKDWMWWLAIPSVLGSLAGSWVVVEGTEQSFRMMVPWLIGMATLLFMLQPKLTPRAKSADSQQDATSLQQHSSKYRWLVGCFQFLIGLYGGYFGAGIGILMLSSLSLLNIGNIHHVNGLKTLLAGLINGVSMVVFIADGRVNWTLAAPMIASAMLGGWLGATWSRKLDKQVVRKVVITIGIVLTVWYFGQSFFSGSTAAPLPMETPAVVMMR